MTPWRRRRTRAPWRAGWNRRRRKARARRPGSKSKEHRASCRDRIRNGPRRFGTVVASPHHRALRGEVSMNVPPEIVFHDMDRSQWVEDYILERLGHMEKLADN